MMMISVNISDETIGLMIIRWWSNQELVMMKERDEKWTKLGMRVETMIYEGKVYGAYRKAIAKEGF